MKQTELTKVKGIGEKTAEKLLQEGIDSVGSLIEKTAEEVAAITGFGLKRVEGLMEAAHELVAPAPRAEAVAETKPVRKKKKKSDRPGKKKKKKKKKKKNAKGKKKKNGKKKAKGKAKKNKKKKKKRK